MICTNFGGGRPAGIRGPAEPDRMVAMRVRTGVLGLSAMGFMGLWIGGCEGSAACVDFADEVMGPRNTQS